MAACEKCGGAILTGTPHGWQRCFNCGEDALYPARQPTQAERGRRGGGLIGPTRILPEKVVM